MSVAFQDSETLKNLMRAFAGESQARNRYTFAASLCRQQKLPVLEAVFQFTANHSVHAAITAEEIRIMHFLKTRARISGRNRLLQSLSQNCRHYRVVINKAIMRHNLKAQMFLTIQLALNALG